VISQGVFSDLSFCRKTTLTKHVRRQHGGRRRSTDGEDSDDDDGMEGFEPGSQSARSMRHASSASTVPSQDLNMHFKRNQPHQHAHHMHHHPQQHLGVNNISRHHGHHPQAVYLSPNPSSGGPQAPPIYYSAAPTGYPHTPNSMVHREIDEDYDSASGTDIAGEPNPYHRMQMQQPKYAQQYHPHSQFQHQNGDPVAYYSPNLPTPAVSPASSCSGPNLPPPSQYTHGTTAHHSPPTVPTSTIQHQPTPYQAAPSNPQHPQPIHYAAAYSGHRLYTIGNEDVPRIHAQHTYPSSQNMPMGQDGTHGLGINMGQPLKVEVSTPMGTAW
jgi:hypothetical protein